MNDRIKLAEAIGWTFNGSEEISGSHEDRFRWTGPDGVRSNYGPDPFTNANDCEALIMFLNGRGCNVTIEFFPSHVEVEIRYPNSVYCERADSQNWKRTVCELALKVLE